MDRDTVFRMMRHLLSPVVTKAVAAAVVGCTLLILPTQARAQDPAPPPPAATAASTGALGQGFGEPGQFVISGEMNAGFTKVNHAGWVLSVRPAADYFIVPSISIGAALGFAIGNDDAKGFEVGARAGYNLNVTENVGVWPIVGISYNKVSAANNFSASSTYGNLYLPILYHIVPHVFAGIGPFYNLHIAGDGDHSYGFRSTVGGWF
jgi:hypothetical protein